MPLSTRSSHSSTMGGFTTSVATGIGGVEPQGDVIAAAHDSAGGLASCEDDLAPTAVQILKELTLTEIAYVTNLNEFNDIFVMPLVCPKTSKQLRARHSQYCRTSLDLFPFYCVSSPFPSPLPCLCANFFLHRSPHIYS